MPRCLRGTDLPPRMRLPSSVIRDIRLLCRLALLRWLKSTVMALQGVGGGRAAVSAVGTEGGAQEGSPARDSSERTRAFVSRETFGVRRTARDRRARSCGRGAGRSLASRTRRRAQPPNAREPASPDEVAKTAARAVFRANRVVDDVSGVPNRQSSRRPGAGGMSGDAPWKWRRPERTTSSPVPSSSSSRAPLSSHDAAPPPHFPAFLPYKSPPSHPQRRGRDPNTENAAPRTASSAGPVPRDADRALILRDIVDGAFAHACSLTPHRTPARSTSELAYFAPATVSSRTAERELVAVAAAADRAAARIAEEDPIARERALALRQSQLARLRADARDVEASREVADADARVVADADARVVADADAAGAETAAETVASGYAVAASVADAEARRRYRASRDAFALESRAFRGDPYDATLGPGFGPAARARDRRRVAEEVDAAYRRCAACDRGEPHPLRSCDFALGLALGAADRPLRPAEERLGVVDGGATVIEAMRRGGNAALFDAATWRASASAATRAGADPRHSSRHPSRHRVPSLAARVDSRARWRRRERRRSSTPRSPMPTPPPPIKSHR